MLCFMSLFLLLNILLNSIITQFLLHLMIPLISLPIHFFQDDSSFFHHTSPATDFFDTPSTHINQIQPYQPDPDIESAQPEPDFSSDQSNPKPVSIYNTIEVTVADSSTNNSNISSSRKSCRLKKILKYLDIYHHNLPSSNLVTNYPIHHFLTTTYLSSNHKAFVSSINHCFEPTSYQQAIKYSHWQTAMKSEVEALENNWTWSIVTLPSGGHTIGCKWVYKVKLKADGSLERYKARFVV